MTSDDADDDLSSPRGTGHDFSERMRGSVQDALIAEELSSIEKPHVVECRIRGTGIASLVGPFPSGLAALVHAEDEARRSEPEDDLQYTVLPLAPTVG